ncbi:sigma-54-dependent transcriptional regulator [Thermodesulfobacteriota bacterium]
MHTILVVDDEPNYLIVLSELLREEGFEVFTANCGENGLKIVQSTDLELVITDMRMPGMDGMTLLKEIKSYNADLPVIMITAFGEVEPAVAAMQAGAFNYLTKPFNNDELLLNINKAVEHYSLLRENVRLRDEVQSRYGFANMIGRNKRLLEIYRLIEKVAPTTTSVLITGESGTGKELVARAIHFNSPRREAPFVSINCAALPEALLESELFGHEKGAFTGAVALRKGRFELADTGTIFLDEMGEMPPPLQAKLLRAIQEKTFERVGGSKTITVDLRILAATNKDLKEEVAKGNFREDLYYRLNVLHIHLPPLRERLDDLLPLTDHFIAKFAKRLGRPELKITSEARRFLATLPWEGNIRELENSIERASVLCSNDQIELKDVQPDSGQTTAPAPWSGGDIDFDRLVDTDTRLPDMLDAIEKNAICTALEKSAHVQTRAAQRLGITKSLLQYKMKKYGIQKK